MEVYLSQKLNRILKLNQQRRKIILRTEKNFQDWDALERLASPFFGHRHKPQFERPKRVFINRKRKHSKRSQPNFAGIGGRIYEPYFDRGYLLYCIKVEYGNYPRFFEG